MRVETQNKRWKSGHNKVAKRRVFITAAISFENRKRNRPVTLKPLEFTKPICRSCGKEGATWQRCECNQ
jgi:hypothetical protein